jgi:hypothetical protein
MTWVITITAREHHVSGGAQLFNAPTVGEIAHALALINRFTGHTTRPYSVAEHSLLVLSIARAEGASPAAQMAALMHDAHEAFTGDVPSPVKWTLGEPWAAFELGQAEALHNTLSIRTLMHSHRASVRRWDLMALATERRDLTAWQRDACMPWPILDTPGQVVQPMLGTGFDLTHPKRESAAWTHWRDEFLREHEAILRAMQAAVLRAEA